MTKLFQANNRQGQLVMVNTTQNNLEDKLWVWLMERHNPIFWDLEMHEGGKITIEDSVITFKGDNGILELEECVVESI